MQTLHVDLVAPPAIPGAGRAIARIADHLRSLGHRVELRVMPMPQPQHPGTTPAQASLAQRGQIDRVVSGWRQAWQAQQPQVVHVEVPGPVGRAAAAAAQGLGLPVTGTFHHLSRFAVREGRQVLADLLAWHRGCVATVAENPEDAAALARQGVPQVRCIGRGVDAEAFHPRHRDADLRRLWQAGEADPVLLWLGRTIAPKLPPLFAAACGAARAVHPGTRAVIVGDGPELARLRAAVPWAVAVGAQRGAELARHVASADLLVFPSQAEGFGQVVLEAMASGLPVLAQRTGAAGMHVVDGVHGRVVTPGDVSALVQAAAELVRDVPALRAMGQAARAAAEPITWASVAQQWATFFAEVINRPKTPAASP